MTVLKRLKKKEMARMVGEVLSRIPLRGADYYAGKSYLYSYYRSNYGDEREGKEENRSRKIAGEIQGNPLGLCQ